MYVQCKTLITLQASPSQLHVINSHAPPKIYDPDLPRLLQNPERNPATQKFLGSRGLTQNVFGLALCATWFIHDESSNFYM